MMVNWSLVRSIIILPGTVVVFIPSAILSATASGVHAWHIAGLNDLYLSLATGLACAGIFFGVWTARLFVTFGKGTPAPWNPPQRLVVLGPYRHMRNPMITSVLMMLAAEALFFASSPLAIWMILFFTANIIYFPLFEEKDLEKRFGEDYLIYKANVPRWLPRLTGWDRPS